MQKPVSSLARRVGQTCWRWRSVIVLVGLAGLAVQQLEGEVVESTAQAAPPTPIKLKPELQKIVATRPLYDAKLMKTHTILKGGTVSLNVLGGGGKRVARTLMPFKAETIAAPALKQANTMPKELAPYKAYLSQEWVAQVKPGGVQSPPNDVDHKAGQTYIKDQGQRGTCATFATIAALESAYKKKHSLWFDFSENHAAHVILKLWGGSCAGEDGFPVRHGAEFLRDQHVCSEAQFLYSPTKPGTDEGHVPSACSADAPYGVTSYQQLLGTELGGGAWVNANNTNYLETILASGYDIAYQVRVAGTDWVTTKAITGAIDVQKDAAGDPAPGPKQHAMLMVGYHRDPNDQGKSYFVFKNSWGPYSGHGGYLWLSYTYLQVYGYEGVYLKGVVAPPAGAGSTTAPTGPPSAPPSDAGTSDGAKVNAPNFGSMGSPSDAAAG